jgi:hypothetical protein
MAQSDKLVVAIRTQIADITQSTSSMRSLMSNIRNIGKSGVSITANLPTDSDSFSQKIKDFQKVVSESFGGLPRDELNKTFQEINDLIGNSGQKSVQFIKNISQECKDFAGNLAPKDAITGILNSTESIFGAAGKNIGKYSEIAKNTFSAIGKEAKGIGASNIGNILNNTKASEYLGSLKQVRSLSALSDKKDKIKSNINRVSASVREKIAGGVANFRTSNLGTGLNDMVSGISNFRPNNSGAKGSDANALEMLGNGTNLADLLGELKSIESAIKGSRVFEKKMSV